MLTLYKINADIQEDIFSLNAVKFDDCEHFNLKKIFF